MFRSLFSLPFLQLENVEFRFNVTTFQSDPGLFPLFKLLSKTIIILDKQHEIRYNKDVVIWIN